MQHASKVQFSFRNATNKMNNMIALFVFVLIQVSRISCENVLNETGICTLIPDTFAKAALTYKTPSTDESDYDIESYHREEVDLWHKYDLQAFATICKEAQNHGEKLNNAVVEYGEKLQAAIKAKKINAAKVFKALNQLKNQLKLYLSLKPGNVTIKQSAFPPRPVPVPLPTVKTAAERTAEETFLTLPVVLYENYRLYLVLGQGIFNTGWAAIWSRYDELQTAFRDKILNGYVLDTYKDIVEEVYKKEEVIYNIVGDDKWNDFGLYGDEILDIYEEYHGIESDD